MPGGSRDARADDIDATVMVADSRDAFLRLLRERKWDLVLSDFSLPSFDGRSALALVRETSPDLPFILVSGAIGEDLAVEMLIRGATDYVHKDKLSKLPTAVRRAAGTRGAEPAERSRGAAPESEERFELIMRGTADTIYDADMKTGLLWWNENFGRCSRIPGPDRETLDWWSDRIHDEDREGRDSSVRRALERCAPRCTGNTGSGAGRQVPTC